MHKKVNRRDFVVGASLGALGISALLSGRETPLGTHMMSRSEKTTAPKQSSDARKLAALLLPYGVNSMVDNCRFKSVSVNKLGMGVVMLENPQGRPFQVDVCLKEDSVQPIATSKHCALFLRNSGTGQTPTDESMGLSVMTLATAMTRNESDRPELKLITKSEFWAASRRS